MLNAYESERRQVTEEVSLFVAQHARSAIQERTSLPEEIEEASPRGEAARRRVGQVAYNLHVQQFACAGLNFGYAYTKSPIIEYDGEAPPAYTMRDYTPSTVPGCRTPHLWLNHGRSLYDMMGSDYALLRFDPSIDVSPLMSAAERSGMPLTLLEIPRSELPAPYRHKLLPSRPDQHVAWRGDALPANTEALIRRVRGASDS